MNRVWWSLILGLTMLLAACGGDVPNDATSSDAAAANASDTTQLAATTAAVPQTTTSVVTTVPATTDPPITTTTEAPLEVAFEPGADRWRVATAVQMFFEASSVGEWRIAASVYGEDTTADVVRAICNAGCRADVKVVEVFSYGPPPPWPMQPTELSVEVETSAGSGFVEVRRAGNDRWVITDELPKVVLGQGSTSQLVQLAELVSPSSIVAVWPSSVQRVEVGGQDWVATDGSTRFGFLTDEWIATGSDFLSTADLSVSCTDPQGDLSAEELLRFDGRLVGRFAEAGESSGNSVDIDCETGQVIDDVDLALLDPFESVEQARNGIVVRDRHYFEGDRTIERADGSPITEDLISGGWRLSPDGLTVGYVGACSGEVCSLVIRRVADGAELGRWDFPYHVGISGYDGRWALISDRGSISLVDVSDATVQTFSVSADVRLVATR